MARIDPQFKIRIPEHVKARIEAAARANRRSVTAEIEHRLTGSFDAPAQLAPAFAELLNQHIETEVNARLKAIAAKIGGA